MAIKMVATYSKKIGLPAYSSHQYAITVESEVANVDDVAAESADLYQRLQESVDREIQRQGYVPGDGAGKRKGNNDNTRSSRSARDAEVHANGSSFLGRWQCSPKQQALILRLVDEGQLNKLEIEQYAIERFSGKGVKELDKTDASELIEYLFSLGTPAVFGARRLPKAA